MEEETSAEITTEKETTEDISVYENNPDYLAYKAANEKTNSINEIRFVNETRQLMTMKHAGGTDKTETDMIIPVNVVGRISGDFKCCMQIMSCVTTNGRDQRTSTVVWADGEKIYVRPESAENCTITDRNDKSVELYNEMTSRDNLFWDELSADYFATTERTVFQDDITIKAVPSEYRMKKSIAEVEETLISTFTLMGATDIKTGDTSMYLEFLIDGEGYLLYNTTNINIEMKMLLNDRYVKVSSQTMVGMSWQERWEPVYVEIPEK
ncbi:MAG: hypothetical protein J5879_07550 [Clostridia bacterium]|nr:hypothetical protein [Clostridia bacterium]